MALFKQIVPHLVLVVIFAFKFTYFLPRKQITCDIRGLKFGLAVLCLFPEDIRVSRVDYTVYLYKESKDPIVVVSCMWPQEQEDVQCYVGPGYMYDELIYPDHISIHIINASHSHVGMYECQLSGYKHLGQCKLSEGQIVPKGMQEINTDSTLKNVSPSVSSPQAGDGEKNQKQHTGVQMSTTTHPAGAHREENFGTGVGCGIGIAIAVFALGIFLCIKCRHLIPNRCLNVGKLQEIKYFRAQQQEENSDTIDGPTEIGEEVDVPCHLVAQEGLSDIMDGSNETEEKTVLNSPKAKETSSPCQTTTTTCLVEAPNRSKEQNTSGDKETMKISGLQQEELISSHLARSLGQNTLSYESKPVVDDTKEKVGLTNVDTQDPRERSDDSTRDCGSTPTLVCSGHDKDDRQEQRSHSMYVNGAEFQISFTVKVKQHGAGLKENLEKSTICNCRKYKSQEQGESSTSLKDQKNGHITADIEKQEVTQNLDFPGLNIGNLTAVLTSQDHYVQETSEKNSMGLHVPPESGPMQYFGRNSQEEANLPKGDENHGNQTSKISSDFDIRPVKKPVNSQQNDERLFAAQMCAELSSGLDTENNFSSLNGEGETTTIRKIKEMIEDVQEGESSPGAQVTSPTENSLNIRSHVHSQALD